MTIINRPTNSNFVEVAMLTSAEFLRIGHKIRSLVIRNEQLGDVEHENYYLPKGINGKVKKYTNKIRTVNDIKFKINDINPLNGLELLNAHLKKHHPEMTFYVVSMITETTVPSTGRTHRCTWKRDASSPDNARIVQLHLTHIDGKDILEYFSEREMKIIAGAFGQSECRLELVASQKTRILCTPIP